MGARKWSGLVRSLPKFQPLKTIHYPPIPLQLPHHLHHPIKAETLHPHSYWIDIRFHLVARWWPLARLPCLFWNMYQMVPVIRTTVRIWRELVFLSMTSCLEKRMKGVRFEPKTIVGFIKDCSTHPNFISCLIFPRTGPLEENLVQRTCLSIGILHVTHRIMKTQSQSKVN